MTETNFNPIHSIHEVATAMNSTIDPDGLLELILDRCIQISKAESGSLMLVNEWNHILNVVTARGMNMKKMIEVKLKVGQGLTGIVASTGKSKMVNDIRNDKDYIAVKEDIMSELVAPMIVDRNVIGVISLDSTRLNAFNNEILDIVSILANQAAQVFKNLQTLKSLEQKTKIQATLIEISKLVTSSLDMDEVFSSIMILLEKSLKLEKGTIVLKNPKESKLKIVASVGLTQDELEKGNLRIGEGITAEVIESGNPIIVNSITNDPNYESNFGFISYFKSEIKDIAYILTPIRSEENNFGVLTVFLSNNKDNDLQSYLDFLLVVASIASQTIKINRLIEEAKKEISRENIQLKRELKNKHKFGALIGKAPSMDKLFEKIQLVADSKASILITGESGTGKEMIASSIHYNSSRAEGPYIKINCSAIPENLLESELFGHKKGSFTGAVADKKGKFELADTGTIFLDEIGEMDFNLQSKLLRVLQEREIEAVGSTKPKKVDVRIITATNANLEDLIAEKKFRTDLYYRLNVVNITTPPLRERSEDIPLLIQHFLDRYNHENSKSIKGLTREASRMLLKYNWPGNVRELENAIERAVVLSQEEYLNLEDFSEISSNLQNNSLGKEDYSANEFNSSDIIKSEISEWKPDNYSPSYLDSLDGRAIEVVVNEIESRLIKYAMKKFRYTKTHVAKYLGINRNTLDKKIRELEIEY